MKRGSFLFTILLMLLVLIPVTTTADEKTLRFESNIIETWDGEDASFFSDTGDPIVWQVRGSKFSAEDRPRGTYVLNEWPDDLFGSDPRERFDLEPEELGIYGVNGAFDRQGYNHIEVIPGTGTGDDWVHKGIPLPGRVQMVDFWVWGANYDFYVELHFMDFMGVPHVLQPVRAEQKKRTRKHQIRRLEKSLY